VARALAPDAELEIIGIRPGEKLHEIMITPDDARHTRELPDRYVILPAITEWRPTKLEIPDSRPVPEGFSYSSDANSEWLDRESFLRLLE
jgi:UDP-N-acetylglucosamine 4,6-dehydratase